MAILTRRTVEASGLAARHGEAVVKRDNAIQNANARYEAERQAVIDTGTQRVAEINVLKAELDREKEALSAVLNDAQSA